MLFDPEDKGIMIIQDVGNCLPDNMAGYLIWIESSVESYDNLEFPTI